GPVRAVVAARPLPHLARRLAAAGGHPGDGGGPLAAGRGDGLPVGAARAPAGAVRLLLVGGGAGGDGPAGGGGGGERCGRAGAPRRMAFARVSGRLLAVGRRGRWSCSWRWPGWGCRRRWSRFTPTGPGCGRRGCGWPSTPSPATRSSIRTAGRTSTPGVSSAN